MTIKFSHLHCHTSFSMQDAMTNTDELFYKAKELGQDSIAITEHGNMASILNCRKASKKTGVKYIPGLEAYFVNSIKERIHLAKTKSKQKKERRKHLILLAKNETGYRNLLKINYKGFVKFEYVPILGKVFPVIDWNILEQYNKGIICLTACGSGPLAAEMFACNDDGEWDEGGCHVNLVKTASKLKNIFGEDLYLELQPHNLKKFKIDRKTNEVEVDVNGKKLIAVDQTYINRKLVALSRELDIPVVATCDIHYLNKEDAKYHDMLMAINEKKSLSDTNRHRYEVEEFYVKSGDEVFEYFADLFDDEIAKELCENTVKVSSKCENSTYIGSSEIRFPLFDVNTTSDYDEFMEWKKYQNFNGEMPLDHAYMRYKCVLEFKKRYDDLSDEKRKEYRQRMVDEIKIYEMKNFSSYMLITSDFISEAKKQGIRVGPGRGSVGSSLVAYLLGIHEADPIKYGLIFERFLNAEKTNFPDIDSDFDPDGLQWIKEFLRNKYGKTRVAHVSNLSKMTPKVVIKDIARSLELGGSKSNAFKIANEITNVITDDINVTTFSEAVEKSPGIVEYIEKYPELKIYGEKLVGLEKVYSTHAAGLVISDIDLDTYAPLRYDKNGNMSVQYEKNRCEEEGLIKMDLLGLEHLKIISSTIRNVKKMGMECLDTDNIRLDDKGVWNMISKGNTICVFQMGSDHMRNLCKRIRPRNIEDLALVNALCRPSAVKSREYYIARRDGRQKISYKFDCLVEPLKGTLGVCVYEEQLAKLATHIANWDLKKADGLRKLTKLKGKNPKLAEDLKNDFIQCSVVHSKLSVDEATYIWEQVIEPFAGYGFNLSHSIFYSINGYHTAYYKYHYPAAFMAAALKSEIEKTSSDEDKLRLYKKEAERLGIKINAPDINKSEEYFSIVDNNTIVMGLAAVKGVGVKAVKNIIETRNDHEFVSFEDFLYRTNSRLVRKDVIQALAKAGCFDYFDISRKSAFEYFSTIRTKSNKAMEKYAKSGMSSWEVFRKVDEYGKEGYRVKVSNESKNGFIDLMEEWDKETILRAEAETLGEYISGGINDLYKGFFTDKGSISFRQINRLADSTPVRIEAVVEKITESKTKTGKNKGSVYGICELIDKDKNTTSMKVWSNTWSKTKAYIKSGRPIRAICRVNVYKGIHMLVLSTLEAVG